MYNVYTHMFLWDAVANVYISIWACLCPACYLCQWSVDLIWAEACLCQSPACIEEFVTLVSCRTVYISVYIRTCTLWLSAHARRGSLQCHSKMCKRVFFIFWGMCLVMNCCDYCKLSLVHVYCCHKPGRIIYKYVTASSDQLCSK